MIIIPHKKIKSYEDTLTFLVDPARLKTFIQNFAHTSRAHSTYVNKEGFENNPRQCVHRQLYDRPETVMFRRFGHFCYRTWTRLGSGTSDDGDHAE